MEKVIAPEKLDARVVEAILVMLLVSVDEFEAVGLTRCWYGWLTRGDRRRALISNT